MRENEWWNWHDDWNVSQRCPLPVHRLVNSLDDQLRQRLCDDFLKDALLKQMHYDAGLGVVIAPTCKAWLAHNTLWKRDAWGWYQCTSAATCLTRWTGEWVWRNKGSGPQEKAAEWWASWGCRKEDGPRSRRWPWGCAATRRVTEHEVVTKAKNSCVKPIKENQQEVEKRVRMSLTCCRILSAQGLWALWQGKNECKRDVSWAAAWTWTCNLN